MDIQDYLDKYLLEQNKPRDRKRSGKYSPSSFGRCYRLQYWKRKAEPVSDPPTLSSLRKMSQGTNHHNWIQSHLPKELCEVEIENDNFKGRADIVLPDRVIDIKGGTEYQVKNFWSGSLEEILDAKKTAWLQVGWYTMMLKKKYSVLLGWCYGTYHRKEYVVEMEVLRPEIEAEVANLLDIWAKDVLPEAKPRAFNGQDCSYCPFRTHCKEVQSEHTRNTKSEPEPKSI